MIIGFIQNESENANMLTVTARLDKRKHPDQINVEFLTYDEVKAHSRYAKALDQQGRLIRLRIIEIKSWKTRPEIEVHWLFGLFERGITVVYPNQPQTFFVRIV